MNAATVTGSRPAGSTNTGDEHQGTAMRSAEAMFREARQVFAEHGLTASPSKLSRLVRAYRRAVLDADRHTPAPEFATFIRRTVGIPDPTGNTAVRNVMCRGGDARAEA